MAIDLGIDLGTSGTRIYNRKEKRLIANAPTVVALRGGEIAAAGEKALEMIGKTTDSLTVIEPVKDGAITNFDAAVGLLKALLSGGLSSAFTKVRAAVCVPSDIGEVERRAVEEVAISAGIKDVYLIETPLAGAIGAGIDINEPKGYVIADVGAGTTEAAVISLGGVVVSKSVKVGGRSLDNDIIQLIKKKYNVEIAATTAEKVKLRLASALPSLSTDIVEVKGKDMYSGVPKTVSVSSNELNNAIRESVSRIVETIRAALEETPPELSADLLETGIILTGGGAALRGLGKLIKSGTGINVYMAEDALTANAKGAAAALAAKGGLKSALFSTGARKTH